MELPLFKLVVAGIAVGCLAGCHSLPAKKSAEFPWKIPARSAFLAEIPPPPAAGSEAERLDIQTVLALQAKSTPAKIAQAQWTFNLSVFTFSEALGSKFTAANYPQTAVFFKELNDLVKFVNDDLKNTFKRPHPFEVDPRIKRIVIAPSGYSYPSYHSARCEVFWRTLALLDPARAAQFHKVAEGVEEDRVFAGEHFPTDIEAGSELGRLIWAALEKDENFRAGVERLKAAEWTPPPKN